MLDTLDIRLTNNPHWMRGDEIRLQGGTEEGVIRGLTYGAVLRFLVDRFQDCPPRCEGRELLASSTIVLNKNDMSTTVPDTLSQAIDTFYYASKVVLLLALEQTLLHIDDQK